MSSRLDQEKEKELQPVRMRVAKDAINKLGLQIVHEDDVKIVFMYKASRISFYPYSGWHTGKTIKDGRGLQNLLKQLNNKS